jgi:AbrB family looped-hinge helix DNA binding protein
MNTTTLSSKGQVIIPKEIRNSCGWQVGIKLVVEDLPAGILLRPLTAFPATKIRPQRLFAVGNPPLHYHHHGFNEARRFAESA